MEALIAEHCLNVDGQILGTRGELGYVLTDVSGQLPDALQTSFGGPPEAVRLTMLRQRP